MKLKKFIKLLQKCPQNADVEVMGCGDNSVGDWTVEFCPEIKIVKHKFGDGYLLISIEGDLRE